MPIKEINARLPMKTIRRMISHEEIRLLLDFAEQDGGLRNLTDVVKLISNTGIRSGGPKTSQMLEVRREREPEAEYVFGKSRWSFLPRVSQQLRTVSNRVDLSGVTLYLFRRSFLERLFLSGASRESFVIFGAEVASVHDHVHPDNGSSFRGRRSRSGTD